MAIDIDSTIRVELEPGLPMSETTREEFLRLGASPNKDCSIWVIRAASETHAANIQPILERCFDMVGDLIATSWWSSQWSLSVWLTISTAGEFVGLVVPSDCAKRAASLDVDVVLSIYTSQEDSNAPQKN